MRAISLFVAALMALTAAPAASADPKCKRRDITDNTHTFTYNASDGDIEQATSGTKFDRNDKVTFHVFVREREGADVGERLLGNLSLRLLADRPIEYDGVFKLKIETYEGADVLTDERKARIVLRPKKGQKNGRVKFHFDLPSGDYIATARFKTDS